MRLGRIFITTTRAVENMSTVANRAAKICRGRIGSPASDR